MQKIGVPPIHMNPPKIKFRIEWDQSQVATTTRLRVIKQKLEGVQSSRA